MNDIVASSITLFSIVPRDGSQNKSRRQRVSSSILLILATSRPGTSESWSKTGLQSMAVSNEISGVQEQNIECASVQFGQVCTSSVQI